MIYAFIYEELQKELQNAQKKDVKEVEDNKNKKKDRDVNERINERIKRGLSMLEFEKPHFQFVTPERQILSQMNHVLELQRNMLNDFIEKYSLNTLPPPQAQKPSYQLKLPSELQFPSPPSFSFFSIPDSSVSNYPNMRSASEN